MVILPGEEEREWASLETALDPDSTALGSELLNDGVSWLCFRAVLCTVQYVRCSPYGVEQCDYFEMLKCKHGALVWTQATVNHMHVWTFKIKAGVSIHNRWT